ncbi:hypothetical protein D3C76_1330210 [compost metagenome]
MRCDFQVEFPETLLAKNVGHRLTAAATLQIVGEGQRRFARHDAFRPGVQEAAGFAQRRRQQQLGIQARRGRVGQIGRAQQTGNDRHLLTYGGQLIGLVLGQQRLDHCIDAPGEDFVEGIQGQVDPVVGDPALGEVVGADAFRAIPRTHQQLTLAGDGIRGGAGLLVV